MGKTCSYYFCTAMKPRKRKPNGKKENLAFHLDHYHNTRAHILLKAGPVRLFVSISAMFELVGSHATRIVPAAIAS